MTAQAPSGPALPGLLLDDVFVTAGGRPLTAPVSLAVAPGEVATLTGPSGAGKSTLLAAVCGTLDPALAAHGRIRLDGRDIAGLPPERRGIGILFQDDLLFPHLSVGDNLAFALPPGGGRARRRQAVEQALAQVGLAGFTDRDPATLSGGQRARAALMRTLLAGPRALLLDEPFAGLDRALRGHIRRLVFGHIRRRGLPGLLVTHDAEDAAEAGGRRIGLSPGRAGHGVATGADVGAETMEPP